MRKTLWCAALLGLCASGAAAQSVLDNNMRGSDTLFNIMNDPTDGIIAQLVASGEIAPGSIIYSGTGSGNGETDLRVNFQEIAPMSRFLNAAACGDAAAQPGGCYVIGLDGLSIAADDTEDTNCDVLRYTGTLTVTDLNGDGTTEPNYTFTDWRDVLRIVYAGQHAHISGSICGQAFPARSPISEKNCNSDTRRALVANWSNLFEGGCTDSECATGGLRHAWRRDDASGTTEVFLELLSLPAITATPFCNGPDAGTGNNPAAADADPIRRTCDVNEQICTGAGATPNTTGNGLVLPIRVPIPASGVDPYFGATLSCTDSTIVSGTFGDVAMLLTDPPGCPNGAPRISGTCKFPKRQGTGTAATGYNCLAHAGNDPPGTPSPAAFDARVYNLSPRASNGTAINNAAVTSSKNSPWYRIHQTRALASATPGTFCREPDASDQIGCLVNASPCSIGYAGVGAVGDGATPDAYPDRKGLGLRNDNGSANAFPTQAGIQAACAIRYPLTRNLYICTLDEFADTGGQAASFVTAQQEILELVTTEQANRDRAVVSAGFIQAPFPSQFIECP